MLFHKHIPSSPLNNYIDFILYLEGNNQGAGLPKTAMSMVFNLNDSFKLYSDHHFSSYTDYKKYWIAGLQLKPSYVESYGTSKMIVIQFKTIGAYLFLQHPLDIFTDTYTPLDNVYSKEAEETWEQLQEAKTIKEKILQAEVFLYKKLLKDRLPHEKLLVAANYLLNTSEFSSVEAVCKKTGVSRKHLNHLFKAYVGVSTKTMKSLHRFQYLLAEISKNPDLNLTSLAYEMDYSDMAHFSNDFKKLTGIYPTAYIKLVKENPSLKIVPHFIPAS
ncbi:MAG: helix-turn-helix domain-containing protein [Chitinophagaceae bacterium]